MQADYQESEASQTALLETQASVVKLPRLLDPKSVLDCHDDKSTFPLGLP